MPWGHFSASMLVVGSAQMVKDFVNRCVCPYTRSIKTFLSSLLTRAKKTTALKAKAIVCQSQVSVTSLRARPAAGG